LFTINKIEEYPSHCGQESKMTYWCLSPARPVSATVQWTPEVAIWGSTVRYNKIRQDTPQDKIQSKNVS